MHLVYVIDNLGSGGAQRQLVELSRELRRRLGWRVSCLVYRRDGFYAERLRETGVQIVELPKRRRLDPLLPARMAAWLRAERADVVHSFMLNPSLWTLFAVRSMGRSRPAFAAAERDSVIGRTPRQRALQMLVYHGCDAVTANSSVAAEAIAARLRVPARRIHYLPNGIDLAAWDREAERTSPLPREPERLHLALIGRLQPQKDHALLFEALRRIEPARRATWRVWCVGASPDGAEMARALEAQVRASGLQEVVRFVAPTPQVPALMRSLDVLVLPSRHEGFPNVVLEAMASRLPVVASRVGDVPRLVEDGATGYLFESGDADGLAAALLRACELPAAQRRAMGQRARASVEGRYDLATVAGAHARFYESLARAA